MTTSNTDTGDTQAYINTATNNAYNNLPPRESLITTAVSFLHNDRVRNTTILQKQQFLKSKGLTTDEIQLACERAGVFTADPTKPPTVINMGISSQTHSQYPLQAQTPYGRIKEVLNSIALVSGLAYAMYLFWKKYIVPFLFGRNKKRKPVDEVLDDIDKKIDTVIVDVNRELRQIKETVTLYQSEQNQQINRDFSNFRSDLDAIKGLLLNRKQFASPLLASSSIPAWQLSSPHHHERHSQSDDIEKVDDNGSGSGSSETEVVTKNSDSSLEIM